MLILRWILQRLEKICCVSLVTAYGVLFSHPIGKNTWKYCKLQKFRLGPGKESEQHLAFCFVLIFVFVFFFCFLVCCCFIFVVWILLKEVRENLEREQAYKRVCHEPAGAIRSEKCPGTKSFMNLDEEA